jgi:hypothetical protein
MNKGDAEPIIDIERKRPNSRQALEYIIDSVYLVLIKY